MRRSRSSSITSAKLEYYHRLVSKTILDLQVSTFNGILSMKIERSSVFS